MTTIGKAATAKLIDRITGPQGLNANLAALSEDPAGGLQLERIRTQNVAQELAERSEAVQYPTLHIYCEKIVNRQTEKFRRFSGVVEMAMELRHSQDRLEGMEEIVGWYVEAATEVLRSGQGDWGDGMFYGGEDQVVFGPIKRGGRNFLQAAKITFEIGVSKN
jgi:hypothetical protein